MGPQVDVVRDSLPQQAKVWDQQSAVMGSLASEAGSTGSSGWDFPFGVAVKAYNTARTDVRTLCGQGQQEMKRIADALVQAYQRYNGNEGTIKARIHDIAGDKKSH